MFKLFISILILITNIGGFNKPDVANLAPDAPKSNVDLQIENNDANEEDFSKETASELNITESNKVETYNTRSGNEIGLVSVKAVENAEPLIPVSPTPSFTPTAYTRPTIFITPTPTIIDPRPSPIYEPCPPPPPCLSYPTDYKSFEGKINFKTTECPVYPDVMCPIYDLY